MPLSEKDRLRVEDTILDLHFTANKYIENGKDIHKKILEVSIQEAIEMLQDLQEDMVDDDKVYDYKMHMLLPLQIYELLKIREITDPQTEEDEQ
jgi:hypothetical protein